MWAWTAFILLIVVDLGGLVLCAFTLPGTWLMLGAAAVYAWVTRGAYVAWPTLLVLLGLALTAEVLEFVFGGAGAKKAGASKWGIAGGLLGALLGGIFLTGFIPVPILGTVVGICLGSFAGAFTVELALGKPVGRSVRIGFGAFKGRLLGMVAKFSIGLTMFTLSVVSALGVGPWAKAKGKVGPAPVVMTTTAPTTVPTTEPGG